MTKKLSQRQLTPARGADVLPLEGVDLASLMALLGNHWEVLEGRRLEKEFKFNDFQGALDFTNRVGALAESVDHHPEIWLAWGKVRITVWTHSIGGLSEADFVFAARVDQIFKVP